MLASDRYWNPGSRKGSAAVGRGAAFSMAFATSCVNRFRILIREHDLTEHRMNSIGEYVGSIWLLAAPTGMSARTPASYSSGRTVMMTGANPTPNRWRWPSWHKHYRLLTVT